MGRCCAVGNPRAKGCRHGHWPCAVADAERGQDDIPQSRANARRAASPGGASPSVDRSSPMSTNYVHWHDGVEYDEASNTWRGYIEDNDYTEKRFAEGTFEDKGDAVV